MAKPASGTPSVRLDQWADGPVLQGDADGTGQTNEVFVNGNLNAQKAHYNEGDAIPYRAIMDDLTPGVTYGLVIQWDTVDSGAYALDYLVGYNFTFEGTKHPGEPDVTPTVGVNDVSSSTSSTVAIPTDSQLLTGFGSQFGTTDGLSSGQPSGTQYITIFGAVSNLSTSAITYNADLTKASITIFFTYTGSSADNADSVVVAWGGHIASSLDWTDDPGETVDTASDISGSPYHMRVLSLSINGVTTSIGNQDRSLSADAVLPPNPPDAGGVNVVVDDDDVTGGIGDAATGDDAAAATSAQLPVTDATSVDFADLQGDAVLDTSSAAVKSGGVALFYFWDGASSTLYASTNVSTLATATATAVFTLQIQQDPPGVFTYNFNQIGQVDHPAGNNENDLFVDLVYTATGLGGSDTGTISVKLDDDLPVPVSSPQPITATVEEDGMSSAVTPEAGGLNGNDQSLGNPAASGDSLSDDQASGAVGSLAPLVNVGADDPGVFSLRNVTTGLPTLFSKGVAVTYAVTDSGDADTLLDTLTASAGARTVFTLKVNPNGSWDFDLDDQLDHVAGGGENTALRTNLAGTTSTASIDFSSILQVTDFDGDTTAPFPAGVFAVTVQDDTPDPITPSGLTVHNIVDTTPGTPSATAALGYFGNVGADDNGTVAFVGGTNGQVLTGDVLGNGIPAPENLLAGGSTVYLFGFGTSTLRATTSSTNADPATNTVFVMTLNPDGSVQANDLYGITIFQQIANIQEVQFGDFTAKVASGNPDFKLVENIGGSTVDALFSGYVNGTQASVNIATVGVGVDGGQDFAAGDRMQIQFLQDDGAGNSVVTDSEEQVINRFTFIMNQNNPPADDGDLTVRAYDASGAEVQITGILINGSNLVGGSNPGPVATNDQQPGGGTEVVTADANGLGYDLHGLGGGTGGSTADNDTVTIITASGYVRLDIIATGADTNKDTFDILLKSLAVPTVRDVTFTVQAQLTDEDGDTSAAANLNVTLDADGVFATLAAADFA